MSNHTAAQTSTSPSLSPGRRLLFVLLTLFLVLGMVEIGSLALLAWTGVADSDMAQENPDGATPVDQENTGAGGKNEGDTATSKGIADPAMRGMVARIRGQQSIHPFLGYVLDADLHPTALEERRDREAVRYGFPWGFEAIFHPPAEDQVVIAILGGSVASIFAGNGGPTLRRFLRRIPRFAGKKVVIVNLALGGYKQPQQLMALTYFLSLGAHFDMVFNIDGFNEVALPPNDNLPQGVFPFYPRAWRLRVENLDPGERAAMGQVSYLRQLADERRRNRANSPLRISPTFRLLSLLSERRLRGRIEAAELALLEDTEGASYQARGPQRPYDSEEEMIEDLARHWQRSSFLLHRLCQANGIEYHHFLQPNQYVEGSKPLTPEELRVAWQDDHRYRPMVIRAYPRLLSMGQELNSQGVAFHDMTQVFAGNTEDLYMDSCCHFNRRGNVILALAMLRRLEAHGKE